MSDMAILRQLRQESPLKGSRRVKFDLGPGLVQALKSIIRQQATGLGAAGFRNPLFLPLFWILAISSFVLFFTASRLGSKVLRIVLFWIPTLFVSALGFGLVALFTYGWDAL